MFTKALSFFKAALGSISVLSPILTLFGVTLPPVALAIVPLAVDLMGHAEEALGDGTGAIKKAAVTAGLEGFTQAMATLSTGGQKETWQKITPEMVGGLIDTVAAVANGLAEKEVFDNTQFEQMKAGTA